MWYFFLDLGESMISEFRCGVFLLLLILSAIGHADQTESSLSKNQPVKAWSLASFLREEMGVKFDGSSPYLVVKLSGGKVAVFRSEGHEAWGSQAEVAAYRMSQYLGLGDLVPETVVRRLSKVDFPSGQWPYAEASRLGSLQEFLPARPVLQEELDRADPDRMASLELLSFLMGRFDNHLGNTLIDPNGRVFIIDFENGLQHQKVRYGEHPYIRYGKGRWDLPSVDKDVPFDFDGARVMVEPSLAELEEHLQPYRAPWSGPVEVVHKRVSNSTDRSLRSVVWDHRLWIQVKVQSRHPAATNRYPPALMARLRALTLEILERDILLPPYTKEHALEILERRDQILSASGEV